MLGAVFRSGTRLPRWKFDFQSFRQLPHGISNRRFIIDGLTFDEPLSFNNLRPGLLFHETLVEPTDVCAQPGSSARARTQSVVRLVAFVNLIELPPYPKPCFLFNVFTLVFGGVVRNLKRQDAMVGRLIQV